MLNSEELIELEEALRPKLDDRLEEILCSLNRNGKLEEFLEMIQMSDLLCADNGYRPYRTGKIVVLGYSTIKPQILLAVGQQCGLDKERFELHLDYEDAKQFDIRKMQYQPNYSIVLVGPMPHSGIGKESFGSVIAAMERQDGYPPVVRLGSNELKITKTNFRSTLQTLIQLNKIAV